LGRERGVKLPTSVKLINAYPTLRLLVTSLEIDVVCLLAVIREVNSKIHEIISSKARLVNDTL